MATSFINERTAEYYLVPALKKVLEKEYTEVASVFPWLSREFSKISKEHYGDPNQYPLIFEANKPMLQDPDKIYPGQVLRIPAMESKR